MDALLGVLASLSLLSSVCGVFTLTPTASAFLISSSEFYWGHMLRGDRSEMHARLKKVGLLVFLINQLFVVFGLSFGGWSCCVQCVESDKPVGAVLEWEGGELTADRARVRPFG